MVLKPAGLKAQRNHPKARPEKFPLNRVHPVISTNLADVLARASCCSLLGYRTGGVTSLFVHPGCM